jgi:predicted enzyme related to lactoylglutathione lyase
MLTLRGRFVWDDAMTNDTEAATFISSDLLALLAEKHLMPGNRTDRISGAMVADLIVIPEGPRADETRFRWLGCVETDDIDADVRRVWTEGGTIMQPPEDIADVGRFAIVSDPDGAVFLLFQPNIEAGDKQDNKRGLPGVPARHSHRRGPREAVVTVMLDLAGSADPATGNRIIASGAAR